MLAQAGEKRCCEDCIAPPRRPLRQGRLTGDDGAAPLGPATEPWAEVVRLDPIAWEIVARIAHQHGGLQRGLQLVLQLMAVVGGLERLHHGIQRGEVERASPAGRPLGPAPRPHGLGPCPAVPGQAPGPAVRYTAAAPAPGPGPPRGPAGRPRRGGRRPGPLARALARGPQRRGAGSPRRAGTAAGRRSRARTPPARLMALLRGMTVGVRVEAALASRLRQGRTASPTTGDAARGQGPSSSRCTSSSDHWCDAWGTPRRHVMHEHDMRCADCRVKAQYIRKEVLA
jgi:hypothetical protein